MNEPDLTAAPARTAQRRLDVRVSALFAVCWVLVMLHGWGGLATDDPTAQLHYPASTAARLSSRSLELAEAIEAAPEASRRFWQQLEATPDEALDNAIAIHDDVIAMLESEDAPPSEEVEGEAWTSLDMARASSSVLLAEAGHTTEALSEASKVRNFENFEGLIAYAYADEPLPDDAPDPELVDASLESWYAQRLQLRTAQREQDEEAVSEIRSRDAQLGRRWLARTRALFFANWGLVALGLVVIGIGAGRARRRATPRRATDPVPPWTLEDGLGVLVRGDFWNRLYFVLLAELPYDVAVSGIGTTLYGAGTLLASLPMLWLVYRHLIAPYRLLDPDPFGLDPRRTSWKLVAGFTLGAIAVELVGTQGIGWTSYFMGVGSPWTEGFDETLVWGPPREMLLTILDYVAWVPAFEELTFRGLLYFTLRRRMGAFTAAALSSAIFSGVHFYSITGFLTTFWSGMVWAVVFERTRSLLPGVTAHAVYNGLYVANLLLLYR